jgi:outer membrane protein OmpA-like peptidoglycan-associated protein
VLVGLSIAGCHRRDRYREVVVVQGAPQVTGVALVGAQLDIQGDIEFDTGAATIRDTLPSQTMLNAVLLVLQANPAITRLRVEGHTDSDGTDALNLTLSNARALSVSGWLVAHGISATRIDPVGCGASDPLVPNTTPENKQRNRRTEFDIEALGGARPMGFTNACAPNPLRH